MTKLWLISYDISDNSTRQSVFNILKNYGSRVQYSVFECYLTERQFNDVRNQLLAEIEEADSLRWYPLCDWCQDQVFFQGVGLPPDDAGFFLL